MRLKCHNVQKAEREVRLVVEDLHDPLAEGKHHCRVGQREHEIVDELESLTVAELRERLTGQKPPKTAQALVGRHDFTTFRYAMCQADSPVKTLTSIRVMRHADEVVIHTSARSFLHRQVRSMVGSLVEVGRGKQPVHWIGDILQAADRTRCGPVAPSDGLYLSAVGYEPLKP